MRIPAKFNDSLFFHLQSSSTTFHNIQLPSVISIQATPAIPLIIPTWFQNVFWASADEALFWPPPWWLLHWHCRRPKKLVEPKSGFAKRQSDVICNASTLLTTKCFPYSRWITTDCVHTTLPNSWHTRLIMKHKILYKMTVLLAQTKLQKSNNIYIISPNHWFTTKWQCFGGSPGDPLYAEFTFYSGLEVTHFVEKCSRV